MIKSKEDLVRRMQAYRQVFNPENEYLREVLEDLIGFCRAEKSTFHPDARVAAALDGRREVWLRIQDHTKLSTAEFIAKYGGTKHGED
jgi:hypothetical protein